MGADGVLLVEAAAALPRLCIFNPDGSEAEKSGNGLRILARYLRDARLVATEPSAVSTPGGEVVCRVHPFPHRTNVQLVEVVDRTTLHLAIWERGAGYTLASGSSSCAAAAVARRLDLVDAEVTVHMPGAAWRWRSIRTGGCGRRGRCAGLLRELGRG